VLRETMDQIADLEIGEARKTKLDLLKAYVQQKIQQRESVLLNSVCTHNARRSQFAQVWAQIVSTYYHVPDVYAYSGGTEVSTFHAQVVHTLQTQGCVVMKLADSENPIYMIKYSRERVPLIGFSKVYNHPFNPASDFASIMTCGQADQGCPFIPGAE